MLRQEGHFQCISPSRSDEVLVTDSDDDRKIISRTFETPDPKTNWIEVETDNPFNQLLFQYFIDGSARTTSAGYIIDPKKRSLPMFVAQIGVAVTRLDNGDLGLEDYRSRNVLFLPNTFADEDLEKAQSIVAKANSSSRAPITLEVEQYNWEKEKKPIDCARKKILSTMHKMEIEKIKNLAETGKVTRESMLMIDGSLQFYGNLEQEREAFRNVVGVAKSFDLHKRIGQGQREQDVGTLVSNLPHKHRTPAHRIEVARTNLTIGSWYLRLHSDKNIDGLRMDDGVVKLEIFPDDATGPEPTLDHNRCNLISRDILALRHPSTPANDPRWASHLYPIHITERYIKSHFRSDRIIKGCL